MVFDFAVYMPDETVLFVLNDGTACGQVVARLPYSECDAYPVVELAEINGQMYIRLKK